MIDPFSVAVEGLVPGKIQHFNVAILGFDFQIEIISKPIDTGGGPAGPSWIPDLKQYEVTVKISYKGKTWTDTREMNSLGLASLEKVVAMFRYATILSEKAKIFASFMKSTLMNTIININIKKKSKD